MLTIPVRVYAIFRYLYLVQVKHTGGAPEEILLSDRPFQIGLVLGGWSCWPCSIAVNSPRLRQDHSLR